MRAGFDVRRLSAGLALAVAGGGATVLFFVDPAAGAWFLPPCPLRALTGLECPGCGSTRAVHSLLRGDLGGALAFNPLLVVYLPAVGLFLADRAHVLAGGRGLPTPRLAPWSIWALLGVICGFWLMRNL